MYGSQVEPALPQRDDGANSRDTSRHPRRRPLRPDQGDTATRFRVIRFDASTRVNEHDQNADTLLGPASGPQAGVIASRAGVVACVLPLPHARSPRRFWSDPNAVHAAAIAPARLALTPGDRPHTSNRSRIPPDHCRDRSRRPSKQLGSLPDSGRSLPSALPDDSRRPPSHPGSLPDRSRSLPRVRRMTPVLRPLVPDCSRIAPPSRQRPHCAHCRGPRSSGIRLKFRSGHHTNAGTAPSRVRIAPGSFALIFAMRR